MGRGDGSTLRTRNTQATTTMRESLLQGDMCRSLDYAESPRGKLGAGSCRERITVENLDGTSELILV